MKQTILVSICLLLLSGTAPKEYRIKDTTATKIKVAFATIYNYLDKSNMPHQDVRQLQELIITADSSLQADLRDSSINKK